MTRLRRILGPLAATWLLCQATGATAVAAVLWTTSPSHAAECTCGHGTHAMCPMHHAPTPNTHCSMQSSHTTDTTILSSLCAGTGVLPADAPTVLAIAPPHVARLESTAALLRPTAPDPPPPRA